MAINMGFLDLMLERIDAGDFRAGDLILDIGASQIHAGDNPGKINEFITRLGGSPYSDDELCGKGKGEFVLETFIRAGFNYKAVDYADFPHVIRLDLNKDKLPDRECGKYNFIINAGTSEHILNQYNIFEIIHNAGTLGSVMYHGVPCSGDFEHGIISYNAKFFWALAVANDYQVIKFWGWTSDEIVEIPPSFLEQIAFPTRTPCGTLTWLHVLLRKTRELPFRGLNDPAFSASWTSPANSGMPVEGQVR